MHLWDESKGGSLEKPQEHSMLCPNLEPSDSITTLLNKLTSSGNNSPYSEQVYWGAKHYNLNKSKLFNSLSEEQQTETILRLNKWSLELIYFIEKFGLNYGAKMILNAHSEEEKSLYSLFAADEVNHRILIEPFLIDGKPKDISIHPLLAALATCLKDGSKETMTFTIQVILEGFGLMHYNTLKNTCTNQNLANVFHLILKDEVNHHGMGVALTKKTTLNDKQSSEVTDMTALFVRSLIDAEWVLKSISETCGGLTKDQVIEFKKDILWAESQSFKIDKMSQLIRKTGSVKVYESLLNKGVFKF